MSPSGEFEEVIHRSFSRTVAEKAIQVGAPLLKEAIDHASWTFRRCLGETDDQENIYVAPFWLYHHAIEQVDGIHVLVNEACSTATLPLLRVAFEAALQLEYCHIDRTSFIRRSSLWFAAHLRTKLGMLERLDPGTKDGAVFRESWEKQFGLYDIPIDILNSQRANLIAVLALPALKGANAELARRPKSPWYAADKGPANLRSLPEHLNRLAEYDALYRHWSSAVHGGNADLYTVPIAGKGLSFRIVRDPSGLPNAASFALALLLRCTRLMLDHYRPGESTETWYRREILDQWRQLMQLKTDIQYLPSPTAQVGQ